jgi:hypothetical protein
MSRTEVFVWSAAGATVGEAVEDENDIRRRRETSHAPLLTLTVRDCAKMPRYLILLLPLMARVTADTPPRHPRGGPSPPDMISYEARNILDHELRGLPDFMPRLGGEGVGMDHASNLGMANGSAFAFTKRQTCGNWGMCPDGGCAPPRR